MEAIDVREDDDRRDFLDTLLPAYDFGWDLDVLRTSLIERIPKWIEEETGESQLPFPPQIVEGITEEDIEFLASKCKLEGITRYSYWSDVFHACNAIFINESATSAEKSKEKREQALQIHDGLEKLPPKVPRASAFFLVCECILD